MLLETVSPEVALEYLTSESVPEASARELNRVGRGHPLALSLGLALYSAGGHVRGGAGTHHQVLEHMAALFLEDADAETTQVVRAACLVRTATAPLLAAMLPHIPADEALDRLRALPFVSVGAHNLMLPRIPWSFLGVLNYEGALIMREHLQIGRPAQQCAGRSLVKVGGTYVA